MLSLQPGPLGGQRCPELVPVRREQHPAAPSGHSAGEHPDVDPRQHGRAEVLLDHHRSATRRLESQLRGVSLCGGEHMFALFAYAFVAGRVRARMSTRSVSRWRRVGRSQRDALARRVDAIAGIAEAETPDDFARRLDAEVRRLRDDDGMDRFRQQQLDTSLRTWVDPADGMYKIRGQVDPVSGAKLSNKLDALMAELFAEETSDSCPSDPLAKQDHLRALALVALCEGEGGRAGRPEFTVVIDTRVVDEKGRPAIDWGLPVEVPESVLRELADDADVEAVVVRAGAVIHVRARSTSGARRACVTCAATSAACPVSDVRDRRAALCGSPTRRLTTSGSGSTAGRPTSTTCFRCCGRHHTAVHDRGWRLKLLPDRTLTVTFADGTTMTTDPPKRAP